jgi:hypothetical protein
MINRQSFALPLDVHYHIQKPVSKEIGKYKNSMVPNGRIQERIDPKRSIGDMAGFCQPSLHHSITPVTIVYEIRKRVTTQRSLALPLQTSAHSADATGSVAPVAQSGKWREWRGSNPPRIVDYQVFRWGALTNSLTKASHALSRPGASSRCMG